ncbi:MBL fold metallo-hydrolase [Deinococcus ruber]|uniref:Hydrolase n=1 Tax=Deinococcus ruber TaxID=1848197 RepID=A0A918F9Q5_9DEIO|nr:MBL fold metallo-hydrolase [Deinococcus ruber]GGR22611.1 hydrolase [Deinococcus ruber]
MTVYAHDDIQVASLTTGPIQENAVLVWGPEQLGFLIDPGDEAERILAWTQQLGVTVQAILLTHAHFDHIGAVQPLREALKVPVYAHPDGDALYRLGAASAARWNLPFVQPDAADQQLTAGQTLTAGSLTLTVRDLPGHAPGHVVFVGHGTDQQSFAVVGDTLFQGSVGRTDLPGGDHALLLRGIERELLSLPDETAVYPGHGGPTTVGRERRSNPFLR